MVTSPMIRKEGGVGKVFEGPSAPYNTRSYFGAIDYEQVSYVVERYDVYKVYNGTSYMYDVDYYVGLETHVLKLPIQVEYSVDTTI